MRRLAISSVMAILAFASQQAVSAPNVLLILADDMGVEALSVYGLGETAPTTAALEQIASEGVVFRNFWSQPVCSPTRSTIMTGRYGFRTGVGRPVAPHADGGGSGPLPPALAKPAGAPFETTGMGRRVENPVSRGLRTDEFMLPQALDAGSGGAYRTAAIGKWHMADADNGWLDHPRHAGIDFYSAIMHGEDSYFTWRKNLNGEVKLMTSYGAIDRTNTAIEWIEDQGDEPWFMWLSFILPHTPLHLPPRELLQSDYSDLSPTADTRENPIRYFHAMIEAMDTSIGRVLDSMDPEVRDNTYVIFIGDNGTGGGSITPPFQSGRAKGTVYQGGVNVPLIVSGPGVAAGATSDALVNSVDLYATILDMAEVDAAETVPPRVKQDTVSFFPYLANPDMASLRDWVYADVFSGSFAGLADANYTIRGERYKYLRHAGTEEFYDLLEDPYEHVNLLDGRLTAEQEARLGQLRDQFAALRASDSSDGRYMR
ncbi:MAG TPA: sulfatase-like hydrolase/transferase [Gammaproteobacteria bacterium]